MLFGSNLFLNGFDRDSKWAFDSKAPAKFKGATPCGNSHVLTALILAGERHFSGMIRNQKNNNTVNSTHIYYERGVVIETKADRLKFLRMIRDNAPMSKRSRINVQVADAERSLSRYEDWMPVSFWAADGTYLYASAPGIFDDENILASDVMIEGLSLAQHLTNYFTSKVGGKAEGMVRAALSGVSVVKLNKLGFSRPNLSDAMECASFALVMSQIRGFRTEGYSFNDLGYEMATVCSALNEKFGDIINLHELSSDFSKYVTDSIGDQIIVADIAPYVACRITPFIVDSNGSKLNNLSIGSAVANNKVNYTPQGKHSILRLGDDMVEVNIPPVIMGKMFSRKDLVKATALRILRNAATYSYCQSDSEAWAMALYAEWKGAPGIIGSLTFGV